MRPAEPRCLRRFDERSPGFNALDRVALVPFLSFLVTTLREPAALERASEGGDRVPLYMVEILGEAEDSG